jgi:hypothetical protein
VHKVGDYLVFEGVIEYQQLSFLPLLRGACDANPAIAAHFQTQV